MIEIISEECLISNDPSKYHSMAQGVLTIDNVDDAEEMKLTDEAFDVLGFTPVSEEFSRDSFEIYSVVFLGRKIEYV